MVYTLRFFLFKMQFVHNSNLFGSCIIHILYTECAKIKKNNSGAKRLGSLTNSALCERSTALRHMPLSAKYVTGNRTTHVTLYLKRSPRSADELDAQR